MERMYPLRPRRCKPKISKFVVVTHRPAAGEGKFSLARRGPVRHGRLYSPYRICGPATFAAPPASSRCQPAPAKNGSYCQASESASTAKMSSWPLAVCVALTDENEPDDSMFQPPAVE